MSRIGMLMILNVLLLCCISENDLCDYWKLVRNMPTFLNFPRVLLWLKSSSCRMQRLSYVTYKWKWSELKVVLAGHFLGGCVSDEVGVRQYVSGKIGIWVR